MTFNKKQLKNKIYNFGQLLCVLIFSNFFISYQLTAQESSELNEIEINRNNIDDIINEDEKLKEAEVLLKRNYDLMQLDEVVISSSAKMKILDKVNEPINRLNKIQFQKRFIEDRLFATLPNMDSWLVQCFMRLDQMAEKTNG